MAAEDIYSPARFDLVLRFGQWFSVVENKQLLLMLPGQDTGMGKGGSQFMYLGSPSDITFSDFFCGAGGGSQGASKVEGVSIKLAVNHWSVAVASHQANFPQTAHDCVDMQKIDPRRYVRTRAAIFSPECRRHSNASGSRRNDRRQLTFSWDGGPEDPAHVRSRATMSEVVRFTEYFRYDLVIVENVVEVHKWDGFTAWYTEMTEKLGYTGQILCLNSMFFHPAPQSRDRLFFVFTRKGIKQPDLTFTPKAWCVKCDQNVEAVQSWKPRASLLKIGKYKEQYLYCCPFCSREVEPYYYCAANVLDWSLPTQPVMSRSRSKKPLAAKTLARIQRGLERKAYLPTEAEVVSGAPLPFLLDTCYGDSPTQKSKRGVVRLNQPYPTATTRQSIGLCVPQPCIVEYYNTGGLRPLTEPLSTVIASGNHHGLLIPPGPGRGRQGFISSYYSQDKGHSLTAPLPTIPTLDRHALVLAQSSNANEGLYKPVTLAECEFRMLEPHEIALAMGFAQEYIVYGTKKEKVQQYGGAIVPWVMAFIVSRCIEVLN